MVLEGEFDERGRARFRTSLFVWWGELDEGGGNLLWSLTCVLSLLYLAVFFMRLPFPFGPYAAKCTPAVYLKGGTYLPFVDHRFDGVKIPQRWLLATDCLREGARLSDDR